MGHEFEGSLAIVPVPADPVAAGMSLALGFRFHPTDEELVQYYLKRKAYGRPFRFEAISEFDVYKSEPWELACHSMLKSRDLEWYFFSPVDRKYGNGSRLNRATGKGYWKATGKDRNVLHKGQTIGMKKTLVFHSGRMPDGKRTNWVMHEYRLVDDASDKTGVAQKDAFVLCRIFQKSGLGPPNADRYAPFIEEEWDDDTAMVVPGEDAGEEMIYKDYAQVDGNDHDQDNLSMNKAPVGLTELAYICENVQYNCKREKSDDSPIADTEPFFFPNKKPKHSDPNTSNANGSEDSTTTIHDISISTNISTNGKNVSPMLLEFPLLDPLEKKENNPKSLPTFDADDLEKSVPPGYLKFICNLENEILNISMEKETLKIEVMRAKDMINVLQSRIDLLNKENEDLRKIVRDA